MVPTHPTRIVQIDDAATPSLTLPPVSDPQFPFGADGGHTLTVGDTRFTVTDTRERDR
jgi:hypothetical protein